LEEYKTPDDFVGAVGTCPRPLVVLLDYQQEAIKEQNKIMQPKFMIGNIFNFISNVPSDYFRVLHPKLKSE
jgi:hypothetical protein